MEKKAVRIVMGQSASHIDFILQDVKNPLQLTDSMNSSIDAISLIVSRILNTPDIYDLKNLKKEGVCGDYIVLLKEKLMASMAMLPYYTASGEEILYQSPDRLIQDTETRRRVCKELAESSLSIASIVVACLASIQISTKKREQIVLDNSAKQSVSSVTSPTIQAPARPSMIIPTPGVYPSPVYPTPTVYPTPAYQAPAYQAPPPAPTYPPTVPTYQAPTYPTPTYPTPTYPTPTYPTPAPAPTYPAYQAPTYPRPAYQPYGYAQMHGGSVSILQWLITNNYISQTVSDTYKISSNEVKETHSFLLKTDNSSKDIYKNLIAEDRGITADVSIEVIDNVLRNLDKSSLIIQFLSPISNPSVVGETIVPIRILDATGTTMCAGVLYSGNNRFKSFGEGTTDIDLPGLLFILFRLSQLHSNEDKGLIEKGVYVMDNAIQRARDNQIFDSAKSNPTSMYPYILGRSQSTPGYYNPPVPDTKYYGAIPVKTTQEYAIPSSSAFSIIQTLDNYKAKLAIDSCPAMIRSKSLVDEITEKRSIRTRFCSDMYWSQSSLSKIYPYTTLQFLCIQDWATPNNLVPAFNTFCDNLVNLYNDASGFAPRIISPTSGSAKPLSVSGEASPAKQVQFGYLDTLRFDSAMYEKFKQEYCSSGYVTSESKYIADVVRDLNNEFRMHITSVLKIINSLIIIIKDPDTNQQVVRLSPEITSKKRSTQKFIMEQKENAIALISNHYVRVEELYLMGVKRTLQSKE
jgi:hypothetical protein